MNADDEATSRAANPLAAGAPFEPADPKHQEAAFRLPRLQLLIGRLCTSSSGGPSVACWLLAATPAVLAATNLLDIDASAMRFAKEAGMAEPNTLMELFFFNFSVGLAFLGVPVLSIPRALAPEAGAVALLAGDEAVVSAADARRIRRAYIGTTALSVFWILLNANSFWVYFVFGKVLEGEATADLWFGELLVK